MKDPQPLLGNDIVDLTEPGVLLKHQDERFIHRVFTDGERRAIANSRRPARTLWAIWAAKEAVFKIARKLDTAAIFKHLKYEVAADSLECLIPASEQIHGSVHESGRLVGMNDLEVQWHFHTDSIHCLAVRDSQQRPDLMARVLIDVAPAAEIIPELALFTQEELASVHSRESLLVRFIAKRMLAREFDGRVPLIIRPKLDDHSFGPPEAHFQDSSSTLAPVELSLSHDGKFVAAAGLLRS